MEMTVVLLNFKDQVDGAMGLQIYSKPMDGTANIYVTVNRKTHKLNGQYSS